MKYEVKKINWMGETITSIETDTKDKANGIATAWFINNYDNENIRIYEISDNYKVRIY